MKHALLSTLFVIAITMPAQSGVIERACLTADRSAASPRLCGCIQSVADQTLRNGEQRKAARFFSDPHEAQEVRQSSRQSDRRFWDRYRAFGAAAEPYCG
jgi:hypothetical protein